MSDSYKNMALGRFETASCLRRAANFLSMKYRNDPTYTAIAKILEKESEGSVLLGIQESKIAYPSTQEEKNANPNQE